VFQGNRFTALKAVIGARQIAGVTAFQLLVEMLTGEWMYSLFPPHSQCSSLSFRHDIPSMVRSLQIYQIFKGGQAEMANGS
jgi:hypothetical protein